MPCNKNKKIREDWLLSTKDKFQAIAKKRNIMACEKKIIEEMENDIRKNFNNEGNSCANQQMIGMMEMHRALVVKEWVSLPHENIDYGQQKSVSSE